MKITVIPGDGIGPSIVDAALKVLEKAGAGLEYETAVAGRSALDEGKDLIPRETIESIERNRIVLKGPLTTPIGEGFTSVNVTLRKMFDLYANLRPARSFPGTLSRYEGVDIITIRENTQGMYSGVGQHVSEEGEATAVSVVTREGCRRVLKFAYETARKKGRKKVTVVNKANILKSTSGLFLKTSREIAPEYPDIETAEMLVDNCCMQLVMDPGQFDVIVTTNLFGDIISDLCAGLVGGLGLTPGANIGNDAAIFEAVHGSAPDIAGKNIANPSSLILASALMLDHIGMGERAGNIRSALEDVLSTKDRLTPDLGGKGTTGGFTDAVLERL
ncbi:MAG: isocitrate dehydrogenase [Candidatus Omnitrophica bacterium]|nr:isocitrate dehydrogenase [Candidatus Omnitrophota bacterium]